MNEQRPPVQLVDSRIMHARLRPAAHRFAYRLTLLLVDLDRLGNSRWPRWLGLDRATPLAFRQRDHGGRTAIGLRAWVDETLMDAGLARAARVELLCGPSSFGYAFDPIALYLCRDDAGALRAVIYQVHNTFGGAHAYVHAVEPDEGPHRHESAKSLLVSPFMDMAMTYRFSLREDGNEIGLHIRQEDADGILFTAAICGQYRRPSAARAVSCALQLMLAPWKVMLGIHWEALSLWRKGLRPAGRHGAGEGAR